MAPNAAHLRPRWEALVAALFPVLLLLPFVNKAFHLDDPLTLWTAKHILQEPLRFYDYTINWTGVDGMAYLIIKNPPFAMYYAALVGALLGWNEIPMHCAFLVPAALVGFGTYRIATRFCSQPLIASCAAVVTPTVLISASTVMTTLSMLALYVCAIDLWLLGIERRRAFYWILSGAVISAAALTQYFGATAIPLLFAYTLCKRPKSWAWLAGIAIPIAVLTVYELATRRLFGVGLFLEAGNYSQLARANESLPLWIRLIVGAMFAGGCIWIPLAFTPFFGRRFLLATASMILAGVIAGWLISDQILGQSARGIDGIPRWSAALHSGIFLAAGVMVLALATVDLYKARSADALLLLLWVFGTFTFAAVLNWTVNGRSLLAMAPPTAILVIRHIDRRGDWTGPRARWLWAPIVPMLAGSLMLVYADSVLANSARAAARRFATDLPDVAGRRIYLGHWGFQYYMDLAGAEHFDLIGTQLHAGDLVILPDNNMRQIRIPDIFNARYPIAYKVFPWASTWNYRTGAAFYSSTWGPFPYVIGPVPDEAYVGLLIDREQFLHDPRLDPGTGLPVDP